MEITRHGLQACIGPGGAAIVTRWVELNELMEPTFHAEAWWRGQLDGEVFSHQFTAAQMQMAETLEQLDLVATCARDWVMGRAWSQSPGALGLPEWDPVGKDQGVSGDAELLREIGRLFPGMLPEVGSQTADIRLKAASQQAMDYWAGLSSGPVKPREVSS